MKRSALFLLTLALAASLTACGTKTVSKSEIEKQTQNYFDGLARKDGQAKFPAIKCPDDLEAKTGKSERCSATGDDGTLGITVTITKVDDDRASFNFKADSQVMKK